MKPPLGGIHCVLYALFDASGAIDRGAMRTQVQHMLDLGLDGITVLGLATEVQKLSEQEQLSLITWVAEDVAGQVPLSVTICGNSVALQRQIARHALDQGADWLILQPPSAGNFSGEVYIDFFADVADGFEATFAIQNAPQYLGRALTDTQVAQLQVRNSGFSVIKSETSAIALKGLLDSLVTKMTVLNGRGGLEMIDCLRAGADGFVLAPDVIDYSKRVFDLWRAGDHDAAEQLYAEVLPAIAFVMQSIEHLICYGKRIYGLRTDTPIHDRAPALQPTDFGLKSAAHWANRLGTFKVP